MFKKKIALDLIAEALKRISAIYEEIKNTLEDSAYAEILIETVNIQKFSRTSWDEEYQKWMLEIRSVLEKEKREHKNQSRDVSSIKGIL